MQNREAKNVERNELTKGMARKTEDNNGTNAQGHIFVDFFIFNHS